MKNSNQVTKKFGFTIVELLVVIVIIGILTAITVVSYIGVTSKAVSASLQTDLTNAKGDILIFQAEKGVFPTFNNCPTPAVSEICLKSSSGATYQYAVSNNSNPRTFTLTATKSGQIYSIGHNNSVAVGGQNLLSGDTSIERTRASEFLMYADLAPIFDTYGLRQYTISFDIKSANTSVNSNMQVYQQNGSGARYDFYSAVPVATSYARQSITVTPTLSNSGLSQSMLAFYGIYGSGNFPFVKNVKVELGGVATAWTQAP